MIQSFDAATEEIRKSNLLLKAALLRDTGDLEQASALFAAAAEIEERLAIDAEARNDDARVLRAWYSAASAWAYAGDLHHALTLLRTLEERRNLPPALQNRIYTFSEKVQQQREHWSQILRELAITQANSPFPA